MSVGSGFDITVAMLAETKNEAAVDILVAGLTSPQREIQEGCLRVLLDRGNVAGHLHLIRRWNTFSDRWRAQITERPGRLASAVREAILASDHDLFTNACRLAIALREFDLISTLIEVAERSDNTKSPFAAQTLLELAELLYDELSSPRDYRERRDPQLMCQHSVGALETSLARFHEHQRAEIAEAYLLLTKSDNSALRKMLDDARHPAHQVLRETLRTSPRPGVMRVILKYLERPTAPNAILQVLALRRDVPFLRRLAKSMGPELSESVRRNVRRIDQLGWFEDLKLLHTLNENEQHVAMQLAVASGSGRESIFTVIRFLLREGNVGGRRAAAAALAEYRGIEANELAMAALDDPDPLVQAAIIPQLRERCMPGAMARIISMVDSPHAAVRIMAQRSLAEFSFQRYLAAFDMLDPDVRRTTGNLVRKIDPSTLPQLQEELTSQSRIRRMRALQIAPAVNAVADLEDHVIALLADDDPFIRAEAARALGTTQTTAAQEALKAAQHDRTPAVREAAEQAMLAMLNAPPPLSAPILDFPDLLLLPEGQSS